MDQIGRYQIREELGEGGMGTVYLGYDPKLDRQVAIKVLHPYLYMGNPEILDRFKQEATTVATLDHSNVVSLHDYGEDGEWVYLVMRYMKGGTLDKKIARNALSLAEATKITERIGKALNKAHRSNIVHRDIKPGNILFDEDDNAYLSDFGIVYMLDGGSIKTQTGNILGSPYYMSPEQLDGKQLDARSDIYSMGIVLYEMLTGVKPYDGISPPQIMTKHYTAPIPNILEANSKLPQNTQVIIKKAMAKNPIDRYSSIMELVFALQKSPNVLATKTVSFQAPPIRENSKPKPSPTSKREESNDSVSSSKLSNVSIENDPVGTTEAVTFKTGQKKENSKWVVRGLQIIGILVLLYFACAICNSLLYFASY